MAVTRDPTKVVVGYADIYTAPVGTAAPAETVEYGGTWTTWTGFGYTDDGAEEEFGKGVEDIRVEEELTPVDVVLSEVTPVIRLTLAEAVIENRKLAYGMGTITTQAAAMAVPGKKTLVLSETLNKVALGLEGRNAYGFFSRVIYPKVVSVGTVGTPYKRLGKWVFPCEFRYIGKMSDLIYQEKTAAAL